MSSLVYTYRDNFYFRDFPDESLPDRISVNYLLHPVHRKVLPETVFLWGEWDGLVGKTGCRVGEFGWEFWKDYRGTKFPPDSRSLFLLARWSWEELMGLIPKIGKRFEVRPAWVSPYV